MDAVSEVKTRLSIEDVISEYVRLKRAGRNYKGLSPFNNEKTPSFVVSPEKQIWHDFSSSRGGDIFTFVQEVEGLDFKGALELLARKAGVDLDQFQTGSGRKSKVDKAKLQKSLELATKFYQSQLLAKPEALGYILKKRGFSKQTMLDFQLGYSPDNQKSLTEFLIKKGFNESELKLAGLSVQRGGQVYDMFRGRIMIPLHDSLGNVIGFTARLLAENDRASKYINTPSTPLYDKSRHLYGLHLAKQAIRQNDYSIVVEGNLDVIASHQADYKQVVASAGTAMTEYQLKALSRFSEDVRLAFDQDRAGLEATERVIPIASKAGVNLSIITIPEGKDPDELIKRDPRLWKQAIENSKYAVDWILERYKELIDLSTAQGKKRYSDVTLKIIADLDDPVEQDHYLKLVSEIAGIDQSALREKLKQGLQKDVQKLKKPMSVAPTLSSLQEQDRTRAIDRLLCLALMMPGTRGYLDLLTLDMLGAETQKKVLAFLREHPDFDGDLKELSKLETIADYVKILSLQFEELYATVDTLELQYEAARLRAKIIEYFIKQQKLKLSALISSTDEAGHQALLEKAREFDRLLKKIKET